MNLSTGVAGSESGFIMRSATSAPTKEFEQEYQMSLDKVSRARNGALSTSPRIEKGGKPPVLKTDPL